MPTSRFSPPLHRLHGCTLASDLDLSGVVVAADGGEADVVVRSGEVPASLAEPRERGVCHEAAPGQMLLWLEGVARFLISDGREVVYTKAAGVPDADLRSLFLASPLASLLLQRGLLTLHASAVATPAGAVVFLGPTGLGKSLLAAGMSQRGCAVLADDLTVLDVRDAERPVVLPGAPLLRLWPDSLAVLGFEATALPVVRTGLEKRILACSGDSPGGPMPLAGIYLLSRNEEAAPGSADLERLPAARAMAAMLDLVYRTAFVRGLERERAVFEQVQSVVRAAVVSRLVLGGGPRALVAWVEAVWKGVAL